MEKTFIVGLGAPCTFTVLHPYLEFAGWSGILQVLQF
jgi:hypothetical protein